MILFKRQEVASAVAAQHIPHAFWNKEWRFKHQLSTPAQ